MRARGERGCASLAVIAAAVESLVVMPASGERLSGPLRRSTRSEWCACRRTCSCSAQGRGPGFSQTPFGTEARPRSWRIRRAATRRSARNEPASDTGTRPLTPRPRRMAMMERRFQVDRITEGVADPIDGERRHLTAGGGSASTAAASGSDSASDDRKRAGTRHRSRTAAGSSVAARAARAPPPGRRRRRRLEDRRGGCDLCDGAGSAMVPSLRRRGPPLPSHCS